MADDVTLGGMKIEIGADESDFVDAGEKMGAAAGDAINKTVKKSGGAAAGAARRGGGAGRAAASGAGAGAGLAGIGKRAGGAGVARFAGAGGSAVLGGATAAAAATGGIAIPIIAAVAAVAIALIGFVTILKKIGSRLMSEGERLAGFNASLAVARVERTLGKINRDIARANRIGPTVLVITRIFEDIKNRLAPLLNEILVIAATGLATFAQVVVEVTRVLFKMLSILPFGVGTSFGLLETQMFILGDKLEAIRKELREAAEANERTGDLNLLFAEQLATLSGRGVDQLLPGVFPNPPPNPFQP